MALRGDTSVEPWHARTGLERRLSGLAVLKATLSLRSGQALSRDRQSGRRDRRFEKTYCKEDGQRVRQHGAESEPAQNTKSIGKSFL